MANATRSVTIGRPVEAVFAFVADGETGPQWRSGHIDVRRISGEGVGTRYAQGVPGPMGRRVAADYEITVLDAQLGGIRKLLMGGMVQPTMDAEVAALEKLKRVLEA